MAAKGNYLFRGDKTACGGVIIDGWPDHQHFDKDMACEGHRVTCGKHEGLYRIAGGLCDTIHDKRIAGTLHSRSSCPCKARLIPSNFDDDYELDNDKAPNPASQQAVSFPELPEPIQHAQTAKKTPESDKHEGIDAGFAVIPYGGTTEAWQRLLFTGTPAAGAKELFATLNGADERHKAGSIMLLVDPDKQDSEQIEHMIAAKARIDAALEPLTHEEANFLHRHKDTIDLFTSQTSLYGGIAVEAAGKYFERIEIILSKIQSTYKNQYLTSGTLIGQQFFVERKQLFKELDSVLTDFTKHKLGLRDYPDIRRSLGLSSSAITHRWNQTGVSDIEGYATYMEKAAKYVKLMKKLGYVGIALDGVNRMDKAYEACTLGSDCAEVSLSEVGSFAGGIGAGMLAGALVSGAVSTTVCSVVLGALTIEAGGAGMLACGIVFTGAVGYGAGEVGSSLGETAGELIYKVIE